MEYESYFDDGRLGNIILSVIDKIDRLTRWAQVGQI